MPYSFRSEQWLPYPVETVFAFFADPQNLSALMPPAQQARIDKLHLAQPSGAAAAQLPSRLAGVGSLISLSWRPLPSLPLRIRWLAEIIEFRTNDAFCDRQVRGPFRYWLHKHRVRAVVDRGGPGVTVLTDEIDYELPFGLLGTLSHYFVHSQLEKAFAYRRAHLGEALARTVATHEKSASRSFTSAPADGSPSQPEMAAPSRSLPPR